MIVKGPLTYLVRVPGNSRRFVHADHLIPDDSIVRLNGHLPRDEPLTTGDPEPRVVEPISTDLDVPNELMVPPTSVPTPQKSVLLPPNTVPTPQKSVQLPATSVASPSNSTDQAGSQPTSIPLRRSSRVVNPPVRLNLWLGEY